MGEFSLSRFLCVTKPKVLRIFQPELSVASSHLTLIRFLATSAPIATESEDITKEEF
jgi:hypothetical protein